MTPKKKAKPNPENLPEPYRVQPITQARVDAIKRAIGPAASAVARMYDVDPTRGEGIIGSLSKCLWLKDGKRVTFQLSNGTIIGIVSNEPDPFAPEHNANTIAKTTRAKQKSLKL